MPIAKTIAAGLVGLAALAAAAPAQAHTDRNVGPGPRLTVQLGHTIDPAHYRGGPVRWGWMSPSQVVFALRRQGFHQVRITGARGPVYQALAISPRGGRVALRVSARTGRILDVDRIAPRFRDRGYPWPGRYWHGRGYGFF